MHPLKFRTILLFPPHVSSNPTSLPLLTALQSLLNISYSATYCTRSEIFGTSHLRLADPAQFADLIGADGFTVAVFAVKSNVGQSYPQTSNEDGEDLDGGLEVLEMVATGSVKAVDDEDIRKHAQWASRTAREKLGRNDADSNSISTNSEELNEKLQALYHQRHSNSISTASEELDEKLQKLYHQRQNPPLIHELRAFAVSPSHKGLGIGAYVLETIEWLLGSDGADLLEFARGSDALSTSGTRLSSSFQTEMGGQVYGIHLERAKDVFNQNRKAEFAGSQAEEQLGKDAGNGVKTSLSRLRHRKLVLVAIRELGNEGYYQRRGYKSLKTGILPLGTWGSSAECTTVYMEKDI